MKHYSNIFLKLLWLGTSCARKG